MCHTVSWRWNKSDSLPHCLLCCDVCETRFRPTVMVERLILHTKRLSTLLSQSFKHFHTTFTPFLNSSLVLCLMHHRCLAIFCSSLLYTITFCIHVEAAFLCFLFHILNLCIVEWLLSPCFTYEDYYWGNCFHRYILFLSLIIRCWFHLSFESLLFG